MNKTFRFLGVLAAVVVFSVASRPASAANRTWNATGGSTASPLIYTTAGNWVGSTVPANDTTTDVAVFGNSTGPTVVGFSANRSVNGLRFRNANQTTLSGTGNTRQLTLGAGGIVVTSSAGNVILGNQATSTRLRTILFNSQTWLVETPGSAGYALQVTQGSGGGLDLSSHTLTLTGSGNVQFNGQLIGTGRIVKNGSGRLNILVGDNGTYSGGVTLNEGLLQVGAGGNNIAGPLGTGTLTINGGSLSAGGGTLRDINNKMLWNADFSVVPSPDAAVAALVIRSFDAVGVVMPGAGITRTVTVADTASFAVGGISDAGGGNSLLKAGGGALAFLGDNTYTGLTTIAAGALSIGSQSSAAGSIVGDVVNNGLLIFDRSGALAYGGSISGGGSVQIVGSGGITLTGSNSYAGTTTVTNGGLAISSVAALPGWDQAGRWSIASGAAFTIGNGVTNEQFTTMQATGNIAAGVITGFDTTDGNRTYSGDPIAGTAGFAKSGANTLTMLTANTYSGPTKILGGLVGLGVAQDGTTSGPLGMGAVSDTIEFLGGGIQYSAANAEDYSARFSTVNGQHFIVDTNGRDVTFATTLTSATGSLTKLGAGRLEVQSLNIGTASLAANVVTVDGGTLSLPTQAGSLRFNGLSGTAGTLELPQATELRVGTSAEWNFGGSLIMASGSLTKLGSGRLVLSGSNSYPGPTTLAEATGILRVANSNALGNTTQPLTIGDKSVLELANNVTVAGNPLSIRGTLNDGALVNVSGTNTWTGPVSLDADTRITAAAGSRLVLSGTIQKNAGNRNLQFRGPGAIEVSGFIGDLGTGSLAVDTGVTLRLSGEANTRSGVTNVNDGTLEVTKLANRLQPSSIGTGSSNNTIFMSDSNGTGRLRYVGSTDSSTDMQIQVGNTLGSGTSSATVASDGAGTLTFTSAAFNNTFGGATAARSLVLDGANTGANLIAGTIADNNTAAGGTLGLIKAGSGRWVLGGDNTYTGGTIVQGGTLQIGNGGFTGSVLGGIVNDGTLVVDRAGAVLLANAITGSGSLVKAGSGGLTLAGTNTYAGTTTVLSGALGINQVAALPGWDQAGRYSVASGAALTVGNSVTEEQITAIVATGNLLPGSQLGFDTTDGNRTYSAVIAGNQGFAKTGANALVLDAQNTYTGASVLYGGVVNLAVAQTGVDSGPLGANGAIVFFGGGIQYSVANATDYSPRFTTTAGQVYSVDTNGRDITWASALSSSGGGVLKAGAGSLTLTTPSSLSGPSTVSGGTLVVAAPAAFGSLSGGGTILNSAGIALGESGLSGTFAGVISGSGALTKAGAGVATLTGVNTFTGSTVVTGGTLRLTGAGALAGNLVNQSAVVFDKAENLAYAGAISGTGSLEKLASGTLSLSGPSTYTGVTRLGTGVVEVAAADDGATGPLGAGGTISFEGGTLRYSAANTRDYSGRFSTASGQPFLVDTAGQTATWASSLSSANGSLTKLGSGTLRLTAANSFSGGTTVSAGTLRLENSSALGTSSGVSINGSSAAVELAGDISIDRPAAMPGGATIRNVSGTNAWAGSISLGTGGGSYSLQSTLGRLVLSGTLRYGGATGGRNVNLSDDGDFELRGLADALKDGGELNINKGGNGTLVVTGVFQNTSVGTGTSALNVSAGRVDIGGGGTTGTVTARIVNNATVAFNRSDNLAYDMAGFSGTGTLVKENTNTLTLTGQSAVGQAFTGPTAVAAGRLVLAGQTALATSSAVSVAAGATFDVAGLGAPYAVPGGQTLAGNGTVEGAVALGTGATLSPGASPGTLTVTGNATLGAGGNYNWQILNATGTAGASNGWDLVNVGGVLDVASTSADPFKINLWSLSSTGPDVNGNALNFSSTTGYTWRIASAAGGITGFSVDKFAISTSATNGTSGFTNAFTGTFSLALSGSTDLNLVYTAGAPAVITINVPSGTQTQGQAGYPLLAGTTPVQKTGAGTLVVDQANPLTGSTTVQGGRLRLANAAALAASKVVPLAGGTLTLAPYLQTAVGGLVPLAGGLTNVDSGLMTVTAGLPAVDMLTALLTGRGDGSWNGPSGITSSQAAADIAVSIPRTVGWLDNGDGSVT
ncbi:MAG: beta strand repeat-containing protein, partial [Sphaerospermopsis kisseleviana]